MTEIILGVRKNFDFAPHCPCETEMTYVDYILFRQGQVDSLPLLLNSCPAEIRFLVLSGEDILNIDSLTVIERVAKNLIIEGCNRLQNLDGLKNLVSVGGSLTINNCDSIQSVSGLEQLKAIGRNFQMEHNGTLADISQIDSMISIGFDMVLRNNDSLSWCNTYWLCNHISNEGEYEIYNNAVGCEDNVEIQKQCICVVDPINLGVDGFFPGGN